MGKYFVIDYYAGMKTNYELIDCGDFRKLERFGEMMVDRPAPQASWCKKLGGDIWGGADLYFDKTWWNKKDKDLQGWLFQSENIKMQLRLSEQGQVGIFPEQLDNWNWIYNRLAKAGKTTETGITKVLNGFAYTGAASLFAAAAGTQVSHIDSSKSSINWARHNAELSGLGPIRFLVDDMLTFLKREVKRNNRYDALIFDPPAFGRGEGGKKWKLKDDLPALIGLTRKLLSDQPVFILLTCHEPQITKEKLRGFLKTLDFNTKSDIETIDMLIPSKTGNALTCGIAARMMFRE
jgi:23S rRNA (cytosine1962-C5)-methyltransferase